MSQNAEPGRLKCPSAQPNMPGAQVLGVVARTAEGPRVAYLNTSLAISDELLQSTEPVSPLRVLRVAARCEQEHCSHYDGQVCTLASRIVATLAEVTDGLPPCVIRNSCRWFAEQGKSACLRCPQIVTEVDENKIDPRLAKRGDSRANQHAAGMKD